MEKTKETSCWNCAYQHLGGNTLTGRCHWYLEVKKQEPKEIPADIVDVGCKLFVKKDGPPF